MANLSSDREKQVARNDSKQATHQAAQSALESRKLDLAERQMALAELKYADYTANKCTGYEW